jgi:3-methyladenine DNA glycosylase AlkD
MEKIEMKYDEIRAFCETNSDPEIVKKYSRYFKEGFDSYGISTEVYEQQKKNWINKWKVEMSINDYLLLGDKLVASGKYEEGNFAIAFIYAKRKYLTKEMFERIGTWLDTGLGNWAHVDFISTKVFAHFLLKQIISIDDLKPWTSSGSLWKRRAVPVTLLTANKIDLPLSEILQTIDPLMMDETKKVQQGLGWLLRECWKKHPERVEEFLMKWKDTCGRTIIQYATEKMSKEYRLKFRRDKKTGIK